MHCNAMQCWWNKQPQLNTKQYVCPPKKNSLVISPSGNISTINTSFSRPVTSKSTKLKRKKWSNERLLVVYFIVFNCLCLLGILGYSWCHYCYQTPVSSISKWEQTINAVFGAVCHSYARFELYHNAGGRRVRGVLGESLAISTLLL